MYQGVPIVVKSCRRIVSQCAFRVGDGGLVPSEGGLPHSA